MSQIKLICPKCNAVEFKGKLTSDVVVSYAMDENGNVTQQIVEQNDGEVKVATCNGCNAKVKLDGLVQAMQSDVSGKWYPMEQLCQTEIEGEDGQPRTIVLTQAEYESMSAPSVDEMNEEQLREHAKSQDATIADMQQKMEQMMAQMQQLMAQQTSAPKAESKPAPAKPAPKAATPTPAQTQPPVDTNIPVPGAEEQPPVIYADEDGDEEGGFEYQGDGEAIGGDDPTMMPGFEAPF